MQIPEIAERGQGEHEDDEGEGVADHLQDPAHARHQHLDLKKVFLDWKMIVLCEKSVFNRIKIV